MSGEYAGKIYTSPLHEHEIFCATCTGSSVYHASTKAEAEQEFREVGGWRKIGGLWHCPSCAVLKEQK